MPHPCDGRKRGSQRTLNVKLAVALAVAGVVTVADAARAQEDTAAIGRKIAEVEQRTKLKLSQDKFNGVVFVDVDKAVNLPGLFSLGTVFTAPRYVRTANGEESTLLIIYASLEEWAFLTGEMVLLVDGDRVDLRSRNDPERRVSGRGVTEYFVVQLERDLLERLIAARSVDVRLLGERRNIDSKFRPELQGQLAAIRRAPNLVYGQ